MAQTTDQYVKKISDFRQELVQSAMAYPDKPPLSPKDTAHLSYYPIDTNWNITATFHSISIDTFIKIPTTAGTEKIFKILGQAEFKLNDTLSTLTVFQPFRQGLQPYLFIPFKDGTSGLSTYGGGRYLELPLDVISDDQSSIRLDFNKAFNPWCAYRSGYFCPLPPEQNDLKVSILAGEKEFSSYEGH